MKKKTKIEIGDALEMSRTNLEKRVEERTAELLKMNEQLNLELEKRIEAENALSESEEKFRILSERSFVGFFIWQDGVFKYINPSFAFMFSYTKKELLKKTLKDLSTKKDWPVVERKFQRLMNGEIFSSHFQFKGRRKDRKIIYLDVHHARINYKNHPAIIGTFIDVTHLKKTEKALKEKTEQLEDLNKNLKKCIEEEIQKNQQQEQMLMQQSKYVSMGEMVGAIAHQWRQPLTSIGFIVQNLQSAYELGIFNEAYLARAVDEAMSLIMFMSKTIDDFRHFFVFSKEEEVFDVVKAVEESIYLLNPQLVNHYIYVTVNTTQERPLHVLGFPNEFKQVILNIVSNAKNAIMERRAKEKMIDERGEIAIEIGFLEGKILIKIKNNGIKIPKENMNKIFEPYFTTQKNGEGMGIGLNMAKTIIKKNMGGEIYAQNIEDGAMFIIELNGEVDDA